MPAPEAFKQPYDPKDHEDKIYRLWEESGFFNPDNLPPRHEEHFSIVLPPPNVTGTLHMGHAAMLAIEDILVRFRRMQGYRALWVPGTDSAAIATQAKVEDDLYKKEKKTRHDVGRDDLLARIDAFTKESEKTILNQVRKMGSSLDWSRYAYTMDDKRYRAVMEAFVRMYDAGLIYRGDRIVNWDPKLQTTVSDEEIEYKEETAPFYYIQYGPFVIGTVRPETKFGDKYVIVHPDDQRYAKYKHGERLEVEWLNGPIVATVIKDEAGDIEFGTGAMTITPAHSAIDFDIAKRHGLDVERVIDDKGILLPIAGEFAGQHIKKARAAIVEKLKAKGLLVKVDEKYVHNVAVNSRGGGTIEPQVKLQWWLGMTTPFVIPHSEIPGIPSGSTTTLKEVLTAAVKNKAIEILPERFEKEYFHWVNNLRDWCLSRQIWFGHRIPVWYRNGETYCGTTAPEGPGWEQDPDTLDTWFSSGLWTFSTLGWPDDTKDLKSFHPTSVLETGYDILFFWVIRMIEMSAFHTGQVPFRTVYLHGLVRDGQGRKMSKSLGNIIDPLDMILKYGADATRLSLIIGAAPGNDLKLSEDRVRGYKHFTNKIWNVARFVLEQEPSGEEPLYEGRDKELLDELLAVLAEVTDDLEHFRLYLAAEKLYHYLWHTFADVVIEESKPILREGGEAASVRKELLLRMLELQLKALHPFIPFVTEAVWSQMPRSQTLLMIEEWPHHAD